MKRILSFVLLVAVCVGSLCLVSCGEKNYKVGVGIAAKTEAASAEGETAGSASITATMAAIIVDEDGKIISCELDASNDGTVAIDASGACSIAKAITTKGKLGNDYGMSATGKTEWYLQAEAFASVAVGKTLDEVKALVASDYKGTEDVVNAGCTIYVSDFAVAIEKAFANSKDFTTKEKLGADSVSLGTALSATCANADGETQGKAEFNVVATSAVMSGSTVVCAITDEASATINVTSAGVVDGAGNVDTKRTLGDAYGMAEYGSYDANNDGKILEWYLQVDAFDAACEGKDADGIAALVVESGYPVEDVQTAGCTINAYNYAKACVDAAKAD